MKLAQTTSGISPLKMTIHYAWTVFIAQMLQVYPSHLHIPTENSGISG